MAEKTLVSLTAKETADWLSGDDKRPWSAYIHDPELRRKFEETKLGIRQAITKARDLGYDPHTPAGLRSIATCLLDIPNAAMTRQILASLIENSRMAPNDEMAYGALYEKVLDVVELGFSDA